ncbi:MAG: inorganic phosphate transporter [Alloprevotella sp.]|nr:inorganic phosphate transporter [Alloprevotella sp.]MBR1651924.1 inorganic phosphate transporter [Alloprevotella sp.]
MNLLYFGIIVFLFALAVCDLSVGVAGSAVPFMSPGMGSKAAKFKVLLTVAALGVFVGAATSDGMMDVARHGIMQPQHFSFEDVICICLAVTATDIILMDFFNTIGLPTSTTVSMVFGLLGGSSALAMFHILRDGSDYAEMINTNKAMQIGMGIFLSVAIAFVFGSIVMWLTRLIFTFDFKRRGRWFRPLFGGLSVTCIMFFLLISGLRGLPFMDALGFTPEWIDSHYGVILLTFLLAFTALMTLLDLLRVNVFKVIVLFGTFSLAMAFAGNDLVNFIGVPLSGLESFIDYTKHGTDVATNAYTMDVLAGESTDALFNTMKPFFLVGSGVVMVIALSLSKKARKVVENSNNLASQSEGEEVFSSSKIARTLVRTVLNLNSTISSYIPARVKTWIDTRFNSEEAVMPEGASFDLLRASVNLVLAGLLIVVGTSMQLPLSTTYVAFMVGMGSSLADRAWGRETAVYRITGVMTVVGGWFITAGAAFLLSFLIGCLNHWAGVVGMVIVICLVVLSLYRNNVKFKQKQSEESVDLLFRRLVRSKDKEETWQLLLEHVRATHVHVMNASLAQFRYITGGVMSENVRQLRQASREIEETKEYWKRYRRKDIVGMRRIDPVKAVEKSTWFYLCANSISQINYGLKRMDEPALEHVDNNFNPLPQVIVDEFRPLCNKVELYMQHAIDIIASGDFSDVTEHLVNGNALKKEISTTRHTRETQIQPETDQIRSAILYLNMLQETQELISNTRHLLRGVNRFQTGKSSGDMWEMRA